MESIVEADNRQADLHVLLFPYSLQYLQGVDQKYHIVFKKQGQIHLLQDREQNDQSVFKSNQTKQSTVTHGLQNVTKRLRKRFKQAFNHPISLLNSN